MQKIKGIDHLTFICRDIEKTAHMLKEIFNAREIYPKAEEKQAISRGKYFSIANYWIGIMEGEAINKSYHSIAFEIDEYDMPIFQEKIESLGLTIFANENDENNENRSIYFYDYDNHLFELHAGNLVERMLL